MDTSQRVYNESSDKQWSSQVYQKAKDVIMETLAAQDRVVQSISILEAMKRKHTALCDDNILDPQNPKSPYWKHLVASAIQGLKKAGKVKKADSGWILARAEIRARPQVEVQAERPQPETEPRPSQDIRQQLRNRLLELDSQKFENVVGRLLKALGMEDVRVTGRTADGGIDAEATIPVINVKVAVQAKKYQLQNSVGIDPVQRLIGSMITGGYTRGIFITTSSFTAGARETAERPDSRIILMDGEKLVDIMIEKGLGIREVPVVKLELDEEFFGSITA